MANLQHLSDYYPFGMLMPGRHASSDSYRYGFQGQEMDNEVKGTGNSVNYKYRMHDPRLGRFFAVDPLTSKYPHYTPYSFSGNIVINAIELEGLEQYIIIRELKNDAKIKKIHYIRITNLANRYSETNMGSIIFNIKTSDASYAQRQSFIALATEFAKFERVTPTESMQLIGSGFTPTYDADNSSLVTAENNFLSSRTGNEPYTIHSPIDRKLYFGHDESNLDWSDPRNAAEQSVMQPRRADYILSGDISKYSIVLEGHTSKTGDAAYNLSLAQRRIDVVRNYLLGLGANPDKITTNIIGETDHADKDSSDDGSHSGSNSASESENRAVTLRLLYDD